MMNFDTNVPLPSLFWISYFGTGQATGPGPGTGRVSPKPEILVVNLQCFVFFCTKTVHIFFTEHDRGKKDELVLF